MQLLVQMLVIICNLYVCYIYVYLMTALLENI